MKSRKVVAIVFIVIAIVLGISFFIEIDFPIGIQPYLKKEFYVQFGPLAICIELLIAGFYLYNKHPQTNFTLALFGFTALFDPIFNSIGLFTSIVPIYAMALLTICSLAALWLAFSNTFQLGRISWIDLSVSFILGMAVELFFNYL